MAMRKAQRQKAKLRLGISGPAGSGKTFSALLIAYGITGKWENICVIDTENHSGDLYANYDQNGITIGEYNIIEINAPYGPEKYIAAIKECEREGIEVIIADSLTHAWAGEGGLLDKKGQIEKRGGTGVNSWTAWRDVTPLHNQMVEAILQTPCHIICTLRAKMEHVAEKDERTGRTTIRKIGMNPVQRDGMEYEFTTFIDVDQDHQATTTKDRTSLFDGKAWVISAETGRTLLQWLDAGIEQLPPTQSPIMRPASQPQPQPQPAITTTPKASPGPKPPVTPSALPDPYAKTGNDAYDRAMSRLVDLWDEHQTPENKRQLILGRPDFDPEATYWKALQVLDQEAEKKGEPNPGPVRATPEQRAAVSAEQKALTTRAPRQTTPLPPQPIAPMSTPKAPASFF